MLAGGLVPKETEREALAGFLLLGSVPSPLTINREVQCLLPGHYLVAEGGTVRTTRYWDLEYTTGSLQPGLLAGVLRDAVARHLLSDVPLGIFLSGGVDSAGLVALARPAQSRLKTLTIAFTETEFNEAAEARLIANHFETEHHELRVSATDFADELPNVLAAMDQPTNDGVNSYFVAKAAREAGLTVVLSGLGGDELFWGYPHYHWMAQYRGLMKMFSGAPGFLRKVCAGGAVACGRIRGREGWMRLGALGQDAGAQNLYLAFRGFFPREHVQALMGATSSEMQDLCEGNSERLRIPANHGTSADGVNYIEMKRYLHDQLLRDTDVFGMANSVEVRVPYLDDEVVRVASMAAASQKTDGVSNKPLLVDAIGEALVSQASRRRKRGFSFPIGPWMKQRAGAMREMALHADVLERGAVNALWSAFEQGRLHWSRAWSLVVLGARA
jgi:asparagine synthase (glutamine-hydrolysing)